jgi:hypothetical protein
LQKRLYFLQRRLSARTVANKSCGKNCKKSCEKNCRFAKVLFHLLIDDDDWGTLARPDYLCSLPIRVQQTWNTPQQEGKKILRSIILIIKKVLELFYLQSIILFDFDSMYICTPTQQNFETRKKILLRWSHTFYYLLSLVNKSQNAAQTSFVRINEIFFQWKKWWKICATSLTIQKMPNVSNSPIGKWSPWGQYFKRIFEPKEKCAPADKFAPS